MPRSNNPEDSEEEIRKGPPMKERKRRAVEDEEKYQKLLESFTDSDDRWQLFSDIHTTSMPSFLILNETTVFYWSLGKTLKTETMINNWRAGLDLSKGSGSGSHLKSTASSLAKTKEKPATEEVSFNFFHLQLISYIFADKNRSQKIQK